MTIGCSISAEACARTGAGSGACTGDSALFCADTPCSTSRGAAAAAVHSCYFGSPTSAIHSAVCAKRGAAARVSGHQRCRHREHSLLALLSLRRPVHGLQGCSRTRQSLQLVLGRWCWQMLALPHSLHVLLLRCCSQMLAPPPRTPCMCSFRAGAGRCSRPRTPCICSFRAAAGRGSPPRTPCIGSFGAGARRCSSPRPPCICSFRAGARRGSPFRTPCIC